MKMLFVLDERGIKIPVRRRKIEDYGAAALLSGPSPLQLHRVEGMASGPAESHSCVPTFPLPAGVLLNAENFFEGDAELAPQEALRNLSEAVAAEPWQAEEVRGVCSSWAARAPLGTRAGESCACSAGAGVPRAALQAPGLPHRPGVRGTGAAPARPSEVPAAQTGGWRR